MQLGKRLQILLGIECSIVDRAMKLLFSKIELKSIIPALFQQIKHRRVMWWEINDQFEEIL